MRAYIRRFFTLVILCTAFIVAAAIAAQEPPAPPPAEQQIMELKLVALQERMDKLQAQFIVAKTEFDKLQKEYQAYMARQVKDEKK